jgi:hypothetical protein
MLDTLFGYVSWICWWLYQQISLDMLAAYAGSAGYLCWLHWIRWLNLLDIQAILAGCV